MSKNIKNYIKVITDSCDKALTDIITYNGEDSNYLKETMYAVLNYIKGICDGLIVSEEYEDKSKNLESKGRPRFCNPQCKYLFLTEADQANYGLESMCHRCLKYKIIIKHERYHPSLVRVPECDEE